MTVIVGAALVAVAAILFAWAFAEFRRPQRRRWTRVKGMDQSITVLFTGLLAFGFSFIIDGLVSTPMGGLGATEFAIAAGILVATAWILRRVAKAGRGGGAAAPVMVTTGDGAGTQPANDAGGRTPPLASGSGGKGKRRKAA